jgi:hypothetical protein
LLQLVDESGSSKRPLIQLADESGSSKRPLVVG